MDNKSKYLNQDEIIDEIIYFIENKLGFSFVRVGDGELAIIAQEILLSKEDMRRFGWIDDSMNYCGTQLPNIPLRDKMISSIKNADIVGIFGDLSDIRFNPDCKPVADFNKEVFDKLNFYPKLTCYAFENIYIPMNKRFVDLISKHPPLLVGNPSREFAEFLKNRIGVNVAGCVSLNGYNDIGRCFGEIRKYDFEWALISGGVNALVLCDLIKSQLGKCAVDFGHAPDYILKPDVYVNFKDRYKFFTK